MLSEIKETGSLDQRNLTLHEIVTLAYDRELYEQALPDWKEKSFDDLFNFYDDLSFEITQFYVPIVDDLKLADRVKKFVYDSKPDMVSVILDDGK